jgi:hypothetical protein
VRNLGEPREAARFCAAITAGLARFLLLQPDRRQNLGLHRHQHAILKQSAPLGQRLFCLSPRYFRVIVLL